MTSHFNIGRLALAFLLLPVLAAPALAGKYSSGGGRSYSSSRSSGSSSSSRPSFSPSRPSPTPSRPSYSAGTQSSSSSSFSKPAVPKSSSSIDSTAARAKKMEQSTSNFNSAKANNTPPPLPPTSNSRANTANTGFGSYGGNSSSQNANVNPPPMPRRSYTSRSIPPPMPSQRFSSLSNYYNRPVTQYRDSISPWFWLWLLDQPRNVRAEWSYNHQQHIDPARQAELVAADPELPQVVNQLAGQATAPNPAYVPPGIEPEAMKAPPVAAFTDTTTKQASGGSFFRLVLLLGIGSSLVWLVFFKRWQPSNQPDYSSHA